jgi:glycosyltransferase involved in cell wall biosynthesis
VNDRQPLVAVVTPVFNGGKYLSECIESVRAQTYAHWRYTLVNNRSTDQSLEIAQHYARLDPRIRVHDNSDFLPIIDNHNRAFSLIEADSSYCKPLEADDRLFPECLETMVQCALQQPAIGLVCCCAETGDGRIVVDRLRSEQASTASPVTVFSGRAICRRSLLEDRNLFGSPTTMLVRADLIRKRTLFYDPINLHADAESGFDILQESDFAFVHRALAYIREHEESQTSLAAGLESMRAGRFYTLTRYGRAYLSEEEYRQCYRQRLAEYYAMLAGAAVELRGKRFWKFHRAMLRHSGAPLDRLRLAHALSQHVAGKLASPRKLARSIADRLASTLRKPS